MTKIIQYKDFTRYGLIALINDEEIVYYEEMGSYSGEWILVSYDPEEDLYKLYKDWYGSCPMCDYFISKMEHYGSEEDEVDMQKAEELASKYKSFCEIPRNLAKVENIVHLFPLNMHVPNYNEIKKAIRKHLEENK